VETRTETSPLQSFTLSGEIVPEPSVIDRIVAQEDPSHPAADRVREFNEWMATKTLRWSRIAVPPEDR
jgi:hypothetical protein